MPSAVGPTGVIFRSQPDLQISGHLPDLLLKTREHLDGPDQNVFCGVDAKGPEG